jgi:GNAT superfamily N-acetyltransferase
MEQLTPIKSFIKKAVEKRGKKYNEDQATELIKSHNYDYNTIIDKIGTSIGLKPEQSETFRNRAYQEYSFSPPDETNRAEIDYISKPIEFTPEVSGYDRYAQLEEERTLGEQLISNLKKEGKEVETPIAYSGVVVPGAEVKPFIEKKIVYEPAIQSRISDLQTRVESINKQLSEQAELNKKETGFVSEQHKLTRDKFKAYDKLFEDAITERGEQAKVKYLSPSGMGAAVPTVKYRPEDIKRVRNLRDIKSMYKKIGKVLEAPQGKDEQLKGLWHGLTQSNTARDFWTMGMNEMARNLNVKDAFDKQQAGETLDQEEEALLETYTLLQNIQAGSRANTGAIVGEGLQDMIPFIMEFAMTSGTSVAAKKIVKEFVENRVKSATAAKVAGAVTKVGTQAAIMPTTAKGFAERTAPVIGEEGELVAGEAPEEAMLKSYLTTAAEVIGEDAAIMGARALRKKAIQRLANNPNKAQEFLAKTVARMSAETGVPTVQGVPFELVSEEITGALQAVIDDDGSFFTPEAQWQLLLMTSLAGGGAVAFSAPRRIGVKKRYNESLEGLNDIPNANYTESVKNATENITDPEELAGAFDQISAEYKGKISEEDYLKARSFIGNSIRYNQVNIARNVQIEKGIAEFKDDNGNVSTAEIDGQKWYIRNPQDIGTRKVIFGKNDAGEVKAFPSQKVKEAFTQTPEEIKTDINREDEFLEKEQERIDAIHQDAADRGINVESTVKTPHGNATVASINDDGTVTVTKPNGQQGIVNLQEIEAYKTTEQKDAEKEQEEIRADIMEGIAEGAEIESDETQDLPDGTQLRVVNFNNGQAKIITAEGEQVFNTIEERDAALKGFIEGQISQVKSEIDEMAPEERFEQLRLQDEEIASEMFTEEIKDIRAQAKQIRNKKTESPQERFDNLTKAKQLEKEAQRLEGILKKPEQQRLINEAEALFLELESEQENAPYNQLEEWQQDLLNRDFNIDSFNRYADRNELDNELRRAWIAPKKDKDLSSKNIDAAAIELSQIANKEITPQDIVDFILANRKKDVPKTTDRMNEIRAEYKALTGRSINNHEAFKEDIGLEPEKLAAKAETPEEQAYEEGIAKLKEAGYTDEQIARLTEEPTPATIPTTTEATKELFGEPAVAEVPFRTKKKPDDKKDIARAPGAIEEREAIERPELVEEKGREEITAGRVLEEEEFLNISKAATEDLKDRQNAQRAMIDISNDLKQKANIIHSTEIPEEVREKEKGLAPGTEGAAFFHNGEMYIVSDRIRSVSDSKKSYLHELIVHKGLREIFEQGEQTIIGKQFAKFDDLMLDVYGSMNQMDRLNVAKKYFPDAYKDYFDKNGKQVKDVPVRMQSYIAEEFMAELSEQEKIPSKWQEFVDKLTRLIGKTFNLTSKQFTRTDLANIIREQRERFGEVTDRKLTKADNILTEEREKVPEIKEEVAETEPTKKIIKPPSLQKEKPTPVSDLQKREEIVMFRAEKATPDTPEFNEWFKESKVVDENGNPIIVYHGTGSEITQFDPNYTGLGNDQLGSGFYFTTDKDEAHAYQTAVNVPGGKKPGGVKAPNIVDAYLSIQNPLEVKGNNLNDTDLELTNEQVVAIMKKSPGLYDVDESPLGDWFDIWTEGIQEWMVSEVAENYEGPSLMSLENDFFRDNSTLFRETVNEILGYDGVHMLWASGKDHWVAWFPNQIKSASKNVGEYASSNPDIRFRVEEINREEFQNSLESKYPGLKLFIGGRGNKLRLSQIELPKEQRGKGIGTQIMNEITDWADSNGLVIVLTPSTDFGATSVSRLKKFYKGFDFVENKGKNKDFTVSDSMYRLPTETDIRFRQQQAREETETDPSEAQIKAGNYKKGSLRFDGFDISLENPKGSVRSGTDKTGKEWSREMPADYGYFKGTIGRDKDHIDVFIGENPELDKIYVIDQIDPSTGKFDEHKVMMGFDNISSARNTYNAAYEKGWTGLGEITRTDKEGLKEWFKGDTKKPYSGVTRFRVDQTKTKAFKDWFGDSKIVDEKGKPLVMYHGTDADFTEFKESYSGQSTGAAFLGKGFYFSDSERDASHYGKNTMPVYLSIKKPYNFNTGDIVADFPELTTKDGTKFSDILKDRENANKVKEVEVQDDTMGFKKIYWVIDDEIKAQRVSPMELEDDPTGIQKAISLSRKYSDPLPRDVSTHHLREAMVSKGYDGAISAGTNFWDQGNEYVAFESTQIKSATANVGTFDPKTGDIRFRITEKTTDPEIAALFERLEKLQKVSKATTRKKELEKAARSVKTPEFLKDDIKAKLSAMREGVRLGKKVESDRIKEIQQSIIDYANKNMPLDEAGKRDVSSVLTALRKARTPATIAKAFEKIDELTGKVTAKTKRRKEERNIKRVLKWMTTYKKQGTTRLGKFQYEDVKQFDELRDINKEVINLAKVARSTKSTDKQKDDANEQIDAIWNKVNEKEDKNLLDETVLKLIELRRKGAEASDALVTAINDDLQTIYNQAKEAKTDEDIEKAIQRKDDREFIKGFVEDERLEDQPWIKQADTKLNNFTANVMGNWETLMTMLGGTKARDKFSLIINQVNQEMGIQGSFNKVLDDAMNAYGFKTKNKMLKHIQELKKEDYTLVKPIRGRERGEGADLKISKMHIIDIYNAIQNADIRDDMYMAYGDIVVDEEGNYDREAQKAIGRKRINSLIKELSEGDKAFANSMQEQVDEYYNSTNQVFVKMFNRDLPKVENYWPSTAEFKSEKDVFNQFMQDAKHPSAVKERAGRRSPKVMDAFDKFSKHVKHSEWYKNMAVPIDEINRVFSDLNVADLISENRGEGFYRTIVKQIENQGLQPATRDLTEFERKGGNILGNWVSAKIGMTPSVPFKQLTSVINYAENMPPQEWLAGFLKGLAGPKAMKETFDYMWKNVPYLKDRFEKGYSEALEYAMNAASGMPKAKNWQQAIKNFQTIGTRSGDIAAIMFGGKPYIDYLIKTKGLSQEKAVEKFLLDTLRSQQAPFSSTLSIYQNSKNPFAKALFTFANTPSQYMRKMFEANQAYRHGDISKAQLAKIYAIYGVANQFLYVGAGALIAALMRGSDPGEDLWKTSLAQGITSLVGGLPLIRDVVNSTSKQALGLHVYDDALPVLEELGKLSEYSVKAIKGEGDVPKHLKEVAKLTLELGGLSTMNAEKMIKATVKREETVTATRSKKTDRNLTKIAKTKKTIDNQTEGMSAFYVKSRKNQLDYKEAESASSLKRAYSSAKSKAAKLPEAKAERLLEMIDNSKADLAETDYLYSDIESELRRFDRLVEIYTK